MGCSGSCDDIDFQEHDNDEELQDTVGVPSDVRAYLDG